VSGYQPEFSKSTKQVLRINSSTYRHESVGTSVGSTYAHLFHRRPPEYFYVDRFSYTDGSRPLIVYPSRKATTNSSELRIRTACAVTGMCKACPLHE
jgi:hypothetical protein